MRVNAARKSCAAIDAQYDAIACASAFDISPVTHATRSGRASHTDGANMRGAKRATCAGQSASISLKRVGDVGCRCSRTRAVRQVASLVETRRHVFDDEATEARAKRGRGSPQAPSRPSTSRARKRPSDRALRRNATISSASVSMVSGASPALGAGMAAQREGVERDGSWRAGQTDRGRNRRSRPSRAPERWAGPRRRRRRPWPPRLAKRTDRHSPASPRSDRFSRPNFRCLAAVLYRRLET